MISNTLARVSLVSVVGLLAAGAAGACAASGGNTFTSSSSTATGGSGNGGSGTAGGSSGTTSSDTGVTITGTGGSGTTGVGGSGGACAASPYVAQQLPLDMYIMQDQSGSMSDTCADGNTKWADITTAFNAFVTQSGTTGISVGIQYFAVPQGGASACPASCTQDSQCDNCSGGPGTGFCLGGTCLAGGNDSCTASDYAKPDVEIAPLPGVGAAITASLAAHSPSTGTPTAPALQGALDHATAWAQAHPGHVVIVVLATDGEPDECSPTDQASIAAISAAALAATPSIRTFAIGTFAAADMPSGPDLLNAVAAAGGTGQAFNISTGSGNVNQAFLMALNQIRGSALGCQYTIPTPEAGTADFTKVNVQYTSGNGTTTDFGNVADKSHCPTFGNAWYYDNNNAPTQIELCPTACTTVSSDANGKIDILLGCKTMQVGAQ
jgi:hypothetical protein